MIDSYTKTITKPKTWYTGCSKTYTISLAAGRVPKTDGITIPIGLYLRDVLAQWNTYKELKKAITGGHVSVNGRTVRMVNHPVMVLDVVTIDGVHYRVSLDKRFRYAPIQTPIVYARVETTTRIKGGKYQVNLFGGYNYLSESPVKSGQVIRTDLTTGQRTCLAPAACRSYYIMKGRHKGVTGLTTQLEARNIPLTSYLFYD